MKQKLFFGPPGTGKTTKLLRLLKKEMDSGIAPNQIGFVSFTRKAIHEAIDRIKETFKVDKEDLTYFKTLHALAYHTQNLSKGDVVGYHHLRELGKKLGIRLTARIDVEEGLPVGSELGDKYLFISQLARAKMISIEEALQFTNEVEVKLEGLEHFAESYKIYKEKNDVIDFTDMLERYVEADVAPDIKVLIVDEAQDLFPLQWKMVDILKRNAERVYIAGDDDQAIYGWSGADISIFLSQEGEREVLKQSYRLPCKIYNVARHITKQIATRQPKKWFPTEKTGKVVTLIDEHQVNLAEIEGSWMLLARNVYLLKRLEELARAQGMVYTMRNVASVKPKEAKAILIWEKELRAGKSVDKNSVKAVYEFMRTTTKIARGFKNLTKASVNEYSLEYLKENHGLLTDEPWYDAFDKMDIENRLYYRSVLAHKQGLFKEPRVHINTIHGVKGGEADNVLILTDVAYKSYQQLSISPDDEHRCFYVGITRAKQKLFIVMPTTNLHYSIL